MSVASQNEDSTSIQDSFDANVVEIQTGEILKRPTMDMNKGVGFNKFIPQSQLETRAFLREDTIFLKIEII